MFYLKHRKKVIKLRDLLFKYTEIRKHEEII